MKILPQTELFNLAQRLGCIHVTEVFKKHVDIMQGSKFSFFCDIESKQTY
jgi:hypothetical protein